MTPFEIVTAILNLLALILIPIIAVIIGQHLQNVSAKRKDKMDVFKTMMMNRIGLTLLSTERKGTPETAMVTISTRATRANEKYVTAQKMAVI